MINNLADIYWIGGGGLGLLLVILVIILVMRGLH